MDSIETNNIRLEPLQELQIITNEKPTVITIRDTGSVEIFGELLTPNQPYVLLPLTPFSLLAVVRSEMRVVGTQSFRSVSSANELRHTSLINISLKLNQMRSTAKQNSEEFGSRPNDVGAKVLGSKVLVVGETGRSSACEALYNYSLRTGWSPVMVDLDLSDGSQSGNVDKILKGPAIIAAKLPESNAVDCVQDIIRVTGLSASRDRLQGFWNWTKKAPLIEKSVLAPVSLVSAGAVNPKTSSLGGRGSVKGGGRRRYRNAGGIDRNRCKPLQLLFNIGKKEAGMLGSQAKCGGTYFGGDEEGSFRKEPASEIDKDVEMPSNRSNHLAPCLSAWERHLRSLPIEAQLGENLGLQQNLVLGQWVGSSTLHGEQDFILFTAAARNLLSTLNHYLVHRLRDPHTLISGLIVDCPRNLNKDILFEICDLVSPTHLIVINNSQLSDALKTRHDSSSFSVFDIPEPIYAWEDATEARVRQAFDPIRYFHFPGLADDADYPIIHPFKPPTQIEKRLARSAVALELNAADEAAANFVLQWKSNSESGLPANIHHPLPARLLLVPVHLPRQMVHHQDVLLQDEIANCVINIFAWSFNRQLKTVEASSVALEDFRDCISKHGKISGALVYGSGVTNIIRKQHLTPHHDTPPPDSSFDFAFSASVATPVTIFKTVKQPGFMVWSRNYESLADHINRRLSLFVLLFDL